MSGPSNAPVIIKRKKVIVAGGHHGGAWKVAISGSFSERRLCAGFQGEPPLRRRERVVLTSAAFGVPRPRHPGRDARRTIRARS